MELRVLLLMLLQRSVLHQMMLPVPPPATRTGAMAARHLGCQQCGASLMLLYASVVERGYLAHCGANMALACCHPRLIWCAAARWLQGSRDLQHEIESEHGMMQKQPHKHLEWPRSVPRRRQQRSDMLARAWSYRAYCAQTRMMLEVLACSGLRWASGSQASCLVECMCWGVCCGSKRHGGPLELAQWCQA